MLRRSLAVAVGLLLALSACKADKKPPVPSAPSGSVRVGVWMPHDPGASSYGAAAVRSLVLPQMFRATPAGGWMPDLVAPGSDRTGSGARTATFRLRANPRWSDGSPITVDDLRRTMDARFVKAIDDPKPDGDIVVSFTQALPGWRRLWSGLDAVMPPKPDVWGGRYVVESITPNLETVLRANPTYYGVAPHIRSVHLVIVPDAEIAARLMDAGELDVIAPPAFSARTERLERIKSARVVRGSSLGGWTAALVANPAHLTQEQRLALVGLLDIPRFVKVLLAGEATPLTSTGSSPVSTPPTTAAVPAVSAPIESAPADFLLRALQRSAHDHGMTIDLRQADFDPVLSAYAAGQFDVLLRLQPSTPDTCWVCQAGSVDAALAAAADAHTPGASGKLMAELRDQGLVMPLWRERPVIAVRDGLDGVSTNGFAVAGPTWDIENWQWSR